MAVGQRTRRLVIEATMDSKGVVTGAKKVETSTEKMGKSVSTAGKAVRTAMGVVAAGAVVAFGKEMANHVAVMESVERRTDQVFGGMADDVRDWAGENAKAFGLSENGVLNLASAFGDLLIPMGFTRQETAAMTKETLEAANALSEWTGGQVDTATAAEAVQKAMLGEREMLKTLGISILEADVKQRLFEKGQKDLTGAALQQAKAIATQELIFEKSADALEAYAEGGDSALQANKDLASQTAELKDALGKQLAPVISGVVGGLGDMAAGAQVIVDWFEDLDDTTKTVALGIVGLSAALALVYANPVIAGLALVAGAVVVIGQNAKESERQLQDLKDILQDIDDARFFEDLTERLGPKMVEALAAAGIGIEEIAAAVRGSDDDWHDLTQRIHEAEEATGGFASGAAVGRLREYRGEVQAVQEVLEVEADAADAAAHATARSAKEHIDAVNDYKRHTRSVHGSTEALEEEEEAIRDVSDALLAQADPFFAAVDAVDRYTKALQEATEDGEITREEALELGKAIGTAKAQFEEFQRNSGSYEAAMQLMQEATGLTRQEIQDLIEEGDTLDGSTWTANASVNVDDHDLNKLMRMSSDLAAASNQGIKLNLSGIRLATPAQIERAVIGALQYLIRRGVIRNVYL